MGLFRSRAFSTATAVGALFNGCLYGALICISLYLQQSRHESAAMTGLLILPMSVAVGVGSTASGWLTARSGARLPMVAGLGLAAVGAALISTVGATTPLAVLVAGTVVLGLCSLAMPAMTAVVVGSAGRQHAGVASGVLNTARQAGGAMGVAVLGSLLAGGDHTSKSLTLHAPLIVAAAGYVIAVALAWIATRREH
jgi:MFS transporter, DHA2 family, methylenomycin A resistance protein